MIQEKSLRNEVLIYTVFLYSVANDRTTSEAIALTRNTPTWMWGFQDFLQMVI